MRRLVSWRTLRLFSFAILAIIATLTLTGRLSTNVLADSPPVNGTGANGPLCGRVGGKYCDNTCPSGTVGVTSFNAKCCPTGTTYDQGADLCRSAATNNGGNGGPDATPTSDICKPGVAYDPQKPCVPDPNQLQNTPDSAARACSGGDCSGLITKYINPAIKLLAGMVGLLVTISIVVAGIQYSSAGGDPSKVVAARKRITNAILALLAYLFMFAFLQWLIPGGIL